MNQTDWVGGSPQPQFRDIRNQRASVAERKAELCKLIGEHINRVPQRIQNGSVQQVRQWREMRDQVMKTVKSSRSSVHELEAALNRITAA